MCDDKVAHTLELIVFAENVRTIKRKGIMLTVFLLDFAETTAITTSHEVKILLAD